MSTHKRPVVVILLFISLLAIGTAGFSATEGLSTGDALYQSLLVMLRHFGYAELHHPLARALNIFLILSSFALIGYLLKWFAEYIMGVSDTVHKKRLQVKINKMKNHYIVCGLGRVGSQVAREMATEGVPFVALDRDKSKVDDALALGYIAVQADSTSEEVLVEAGVKRAAGLVASLGEDPANLLVTLAARSLNPELYIVARANRQENELKLKHAGADKVALPYQIGGYHMASMALRPNVVDYMDIVSSSGSSHDLEVEEMIVSEESPLAGHHLGKKLAEGDIGATVIAINGADGSSKVRPTGREMIYPGDRLVILGAKGDLTKASELIR
ncbi:MAG TPA: TrkA family potassium uptake protein [Candidatus Dormibacteraeota bacterium]|nr:TrkA family potassium uptake protein [Candidatus Dormibacteraeota bacterium]